MWETERGLAAQNYYFLNICNTKKKVLTPSPVFPC